MVDFKPLLIDQAISGQALTNTDDEPVFSGVISFFRRQYRKDCTNARLAFLGVPFDGAVSQRPGARFGPAAVRAASVNFCQDPTFPYTINPFKILASVDAGDVALDYGHPETAFARIEAEALRWLARETKLIAVGGDHSVTYPLLKAHAQNFGPLALIQFDAHQDTWPEPDDEKRLDHGSFVGRAVREGLIDAAHSIQIGIRTVAPETCGIHIINADQAFSLGVQSVAQHIIDRVGGRPAYLTFDIDCLDPAYAPGTGTPVAGGLSSREALAIVRALEGLNIVGYDVVEVLPAYDHADITATVAAALLQTFAALEARKESAS